jgi:hypothetical protein
MSIDTNTCFSVELSQATLQEEEILVPSPRFLLVLPIGIGDAVAVGSSVADQIIRNAQEAYGNIDVLGNDIQAEIFQHDPRIHRIIRVHPTLLPTLDTRTWKKAFLPESRATALLHFLRKRHYTAVYPGLIMPGVYARLRTQVMRPNYLAFAKDFMALRSLANVHISIAARKIVNAYFGDRLPCPSSDEEIPLYLSAADMHKARIVLQRLKKMSCIPEAYSRVLVVAPDSSSFVTRPPTTLLPAGIAGALRSDPSLLVCILQGYTDKASSERLLTAVSPAEEAAL